MILPGGWKLEVGSHRTEVSLMKALLKYAPGDGNVDVRDVDEPICREDQVKDRGRVLRRLRH